MSLNSSQIKASKVGIFIAEYILRGMRSRVYIDSAVIKRSIDSVVTERRSHRRLPVSLDARFYYGNIFAAATIVNLSENGMYLKTSRVLPREAVFVVLFRIESELLKVIGRVKRHGEDNAGPDGMGLELLSPSRWYREFVSSLK